MSTDLIEETKVETTSNDGDHDKFSHYVMKQAQMDGLLRISPAVALCGKVWFPDEIDLPPEARTVCPECKDIYDNQLQPGD